MAIRSYKTKSGELRYKVALWKKHRQIGTKTFKRKTDAEEWQRRQLVALEDRKVGRLKGARMTLADFFQQVYLPNMRISESTALDYRTIFKVHVASSLGCRIITDITEHEWITFFSKLVSKGMSKARTNRVHAVVSAIYKMAFRLKYVAANPLSAVDWYKEDLSRRDFWTFEEAQSFLNWAFVLNVPRFAIYQILYETGLRASEVLALQRDCVNLKEGFIEIRRAYCRVANKVLATTKSGHQRIIPIGVGLKATLQKILCSHFNDFVFLQPDGRPITYDYLSENFRRDQKKAKVRRISLHTFRHTFATHFMMKGESLYDLKALMGHSSVETTMRYAHLSSAHLKAKAGIVNFQPTLEGANVVPLFQEGAR